MIYCDFVAAYLLFRKDAFAFGDDRAYDKIFGGFMALMIGIGFAAIGSPVTAGIGMAIMQPTDEVVGTKPY